MKHYKKKAPVEGITPDLENPFERDYPAANPGQRGRIYKHIIIHR